MSNKVFFKEESKNSLLYKKASLEKSIKKPLLSTFLDPI